MPLYPFICNECKVYIEKKLSFSEHTEQKDKILCPKCSKPMLQKVSRLNFELKGEGWFPKDSDTYDPGWHGLDKQFLKDGAEEQKRIEDRFEEAMIKGDPNE